MTNKIKGVEMKRRFKCRVPTIIFNNFIEKIGRKDDVSVRVFLNPDFPEKVKVSIDGKGQSLVLVLSEIAC